MHIKNIFILFNGTGDSDLDPHVTNIVKLRNGLIQDDHQRTIYLDGIANSKQWSWLTRWFCRLTGYGGGWVMDQAYAQFTDEFKKILDTADPEHPTTVKLSLGGYSRGAALARHFVNEYMLKKFVHTFDKQCTAKNIRVSVDSEYLFDTVASFGIPMNIWILEKLGIKNQEIDLGWCFTVPKGVKTYHALSLDDYREPYTPKLIDQAPEREEIWFAGDHSSVGGGNTPPKKDAHMADEIPLRYMAQKAYINGLRFHDAFLDQYIITSNQSYPLGEVQVPAYEDWPPDQVKLRAVHTLENGKKSNLPPCIHQSVVDRLKQDGRYQAKALQAIQEFDVVKWNGATASYTPLRAVHAANVEQSKKDVTHHQAKPTWKPSIVAAL